MKRSKFVDIVNETANQELINTSEKILKKFTELKESKLTINNEEFTAEIIAILARNSVEVAARIAGNIIEKAGLIHFDSEDN